MQNVINHIRNSGIPKDVIIQKTGILAERLESLINGKDEPNLAELRKISKVLKTSPDFLLSNEDQYENISVLFRQALNNENEKNNADKISYRVGNLLTLLHDYKVKESAFKNFPFLENNFPNARQLAGIFRKLYCDSDFLTPLVHLPELVSEKLNCILCVIDLGNDTDGASAIISKIPFIFISPRFEPRMLFTLAHELAHIISHHDTEINFAKIDKHITELGRNRFKDEAFANAFASELLLPEEAVGFTLKSFRDHFGNKGAIGDIEIINLSRIYGVSFDVAAKRCEDLNLLPKGGAFSLSEEIKKEHINPEKRAAELRIPEREKIYFPKVSSILIQSALDKINSGKLSVGKASEILSIPISELISQNSTRKWK
jgi:Zn-dependent peptidase ImmA (M78 family)